SDGYNADELVPSPRVVTGAPTVPRTLWLRKEQGPPPGTRVLFDFESGSYDGWTVTGNAWGKAPIKSLPGKDVLGYRGSWFASSTAVGDKGTGTLLSAPFTLSGSALTLRVAGGNGKGERVELRDATTGEVLRSATGTRGLIFVTVRWATGDLRGR